MNGEAHVCRWKERLVWSGWTRLGALEERLARRISSCEICGRTRQARKIRPTMLREARVLRALEGSAVPHPAVYAVCEDVSVIGASFSNRRNVMAPWVVFITV